MTQPKHDAVLPQDPGDGASTTRAVLPLSYEERCRFRRAIKKFGYAHEDRATQAEYEAALADVDYWLDRCQGKVPALDDTAKKAASDDTGTEGQP